MAKHIQTNNRLVIDGTRGLSTGDQLPKTRDTEDEAILRLVGLDSDRKDKVVGEEETKMNNLDFLRQSEGKQSGKETR